MKFFRSLLALGAVVAFGLAPVPSYGEDPIFIASDHVDTGLHLQIDGFGRYGTYTYAAFAPDGSAITAYCLDLHTKYRPGSGLYETDWSGAPAVAPYAEQVNWLLHQSYPFVPLEEIWPGAGFNDGLSAQEAVAATQAAVWHYTNGITITAGDVVGSPTEQQDVIALYEHLTGPANVGASQIPSGSLSITSDGRGGRAGERIGPLTLVTTDPTTLIIDDAPKGVHLVDADGVAIDGAVGSGDIFLEVPAGTPAGSVTINASSSTVALVGRVFMPVKGDPESASQPLVAGATKNHPMLATITIPWQVAPELATVAQDAADGDQHVLPGGTVQDTVTYDGFTVGAEYSVVGELVDVATGEPTGATGSAEFVAIEPAGTIKVTIPVSTHAVPGAQLVVFERAYDTSGQLVAAHTDVNAESQTVTIDTPPAAPTQPPAPASSTPTTTTPSPPSSTSSTSSTPTTTAPSPTTPSTPSTPTANSPNPTPSSPTTPLAESPSPTLGTPTVDSTSSAPSSVPRPTPSSQPSAPGSSTSPSAPSAEASTDSAGSPLPQPAVAADSPTNPQPTQPVAPATAASAPSQQLADTGADAGRWGLLAASALLIGIGAVLLARRTR